MPECGVLFRSYPVHSAAAPELLLVNYYPSLGEHRVSVVHAPANTIRRESITENRIGLMCFGRHTHLGSREQHRPSIKSQHMLLIGKMPISPGAELSCRILCSLHIESCL
ncbi:hypothetical protein CDAR_471091 [Caerostris darwini]|uniref:Uncharacterized protein n=1 Tax=Caerostris darwini TaxID=1538125 RepID=A0AAV4QMQ8_9ARAC|nr:hypothetical protein CDAR_471091 [Caerostris darwini]